MGQNSLDFDAMVAINAEDLTGRALDCAVCFSEGGAWSRGIWSWGEVDYGYRMTTPPFSSEWRYGGPLMAREQIIISPDPEGGYLAWPHMDARFSVRGSDELQAAMRCIVSRNLGPVVEIPAFLLGGTVHKPSFS